MNQTSESTGARLARLRRAHNITQEALAERLEVSRQAVSKWEQDLTYPETDKLLQLARLYGVTVDYLLTGEEPAPGGDGPGRGEAKQSADDTAPNAWDRLIKACGHRPRYFEYKSRRTVGKTPLVHINVGFGRTARGIIAIGFSARGVISVGLCSIGAISLGLLSLGLFSVGILSLGLLLAVGCLAVGTVAIGAIACGLFAIGAIAIGLVSVGALAAGSYAAIGDWAYGGITVGKTVSEGRHFAHTGRLPLPADLLPALEDAIEGHCPALLHPLLRAIFHI